MPNNSFNLLIVGEIMGREGRKAIGKLLPLLTKEYKIEFTIGNGEHLAGGFGLTSKVVQEVLAAGVRCFTTGNHVWRKKEFTNEIDNLPEVLRPANYPPGVPGQGSGIFNLSEDIKIGVVNLAGRVGMVDLNLDSPFEVIDRELEKLKARTNIIVVDFHAEATSEKVALGWYLDGRVSVLFGTHTHIQTADEQILPQGTAYITDIGMTGPYDSVIGIDKEIALRKFLTQMPVRFKIAREGVKFCGLVVTIERRTGRAVGVERLSRTLEREE